MYNKKIKLEFSIRDDMGSKYVYKSEEKLDPDYECMNVFYLIKAFKKFLINAGYSKSIADRVIYEDMTEDQKEDITL